MGRKIGDCHDPHAFVYHGFGRCRARHGATDDDAGYCHATGGTRSAGATTPQAATPANPGNAVATIVDTEFPAYDADSDGELSQAEFSRWMVALKAQETKATGQTLPEAEVTAWANGAFVTADTDKNATISKPELVTYLSGGTA